jgi:hypothetical protein
MRPRFGGRVPRRGAVAPLTVLSLAVFMGMVALVLDGGRLQEERRHAQATADAAALAAAADLLANFISNGGTDPSGTAKASALATAAANGYNNDGVNSVVTVNLSPQSYQGGPNAGQALPPGYVEVIVQFNEPRTFSNVFGSGAVPVSARAVARGLMDFDATVVLLDLSAANALSVSGNAAVQVAGGIVVNSNSGSAVNAGGSVTASAYYFVPGAGVSGTLGGSNGAGPVIDRGPPLPDPLRHLAIPNPTQLPVQSNAPLNAGGTTDLYPGVYKGGISVSGGGTVTLHANADGTPGIYYLQGGGFTTSGQAIITTAANETAGVLLYNAWSSAGDGIKISGGAGMTLVPPASGPWQGISIFQARGTQSSLGPAITISGQGAINIGGTFYAAYAPLVISGGAGSTNTIGGQYVVDTLTVSGKGTINITRNNLPIARTRRYGLVE